MRRVEQMHQILQGKAHTMRIATKCLDSLWNKFYLTATHLHAKMLIKSLNGKTPFKLWHNCASNYSYMWKIGCRAFVLILHQHNLKLNAWGIECILIGYTQNLKAYKCYDPRTRKIYEFYYVHFLKHQDSYSTMSGEQSTSVMIEQVPMPTNAISIELTMISVEVRTYILLSSTIVWSWCFSVFSITFQK